MASAPTTAAEHWLLDQQAYPLPSVPPHFAALPPTPTISRPPSFRHPSVYTHTVPTPQTRIANLGTGAHVHEPAPAPFPVHPYLLLIPHPSLRPYALSRPHWQSLASALSSSFRTFTLTLSRTLAPLHPPYKPKSTPDDSDDNRKDLPLYPSTSDPPVRRLPQPPPPPGQPAWNPHRRHPPVSAAAGRPGGPPARVVYVLCDAAHAAAAALAPPRWREGAEAGRPGDPPSRWADGWGGLGLLGQCVRAGCLMGLALELYAASGGGGGGGGHSGAGGDCGGAALGWYAVGAAAFLLLQHHFVGWANAARTGAFQARLLPPCPRPIAWLATASPTLCAHGRGWGRMPSSPPPQP